MIASDVTDLPLPDSPTRPTCSPAWMSKETSSTARTRRWPFSPNSTLRFRTLSRGCSPPARREPAGLGTAETVVPGIPVPGPPELGGLETVFIVDSWGREPRAGPRRRG